VELASGRSVEVELAAEPKRAAELEWVLGRASGLAAAQVVKMELVVELALKWAAELVVRLAAVRALELEQELASGRVAEQELVWAAGRALELVAELASGS
jgi:hypothetical protein